MTTYENKLQFCGIIKPHMNSSSIARLLNCFDGFGCYSHEQEPLEYNDINKTKLISHKKSVVCRWWMCPVFSSSVVNRLSPVLLPQSTFNNSVSFQKHNKTVEQLRASFSFSRRRDRLYWIIHVAHTVKPADNGICTCFSICRSTAAKILYVFSWFLC